MVLRRLFAVVFLFAALPVSAAEVGGLRVWSDPDKTRAVVDLSDGAQYQLFSLQNPDRVVIDLRDTRLDAALDLESEHSGVIRNVRSGNPESETLRIVLDLQEPVKSKSFMLEPTGQYGHRLVVDLFRKSTQKESPVKRVSDYQQPDREVLIAIDAGHGGEDPGATGPSRVREKDVVLGIARRLANTIDAQPGMKAMLIRDGDYYVALRDRYEKARKARADLFVSIHADAFRDARVHGSSVFVLSRRGASSEYARLLANSENRADLVGGVRLNDQDDMLASVLLDLSQSATMGASTEVAEDILRSLRSNGRVHKNHVGRAAFQVLKSPDVPSVLVETAFISNPAEEKRLTQREFQDNMSAAIAAGIRGYFYRRPPPGTWIAANRDATRHIVSRGDTLGGIASRYRVSLNSLRKANNLHGDKILVGKELIIPTG